jgi:hypothetical protein
MKVLLSVAAILCSGVMAIAKDQPPADQKATKAQSIDGTWTVVCAEKNGQPMADAKDMTVTVKDNVITCSGKDGKAAMALKVEFTGPGQARVTDQSADTAAASGGERKAKEATFIKTSDYLAVCVHADKSAPADGVKQVEATDDRSGADKSGQSHCTLILKRSER